MRWRPSPFICEIYNYVQITFLQVEDEYRDVYMYVWQICHKGSTYISVADQSQKLKPIKSQPIYNCVAVKSQSVVSYQMIAIGVADVTIA